MGAEVGASGNKEAAHLRNWVMKGGGQWGVSWKREQSQRRLCLVKGKRLEHVLNAKWQGDGREGGVCVRQEKGD